MLIIHIFLDEYANGVDIYTNLTNDILHIFHMKFDENTNVSLRLDIWQKNAMSLASVN